MHPPPDPTGPGQRSVWGFPRPPAFDPCSRHLVVEFGGQVIAQTRRAIEVLETSHPPTYYFPRAHVNADALRQITRVSLCEWKGLAVTYDVVVTGFRARAAAWSYPSPHPRARDLAGHIAFHPAAMDRCLVDGELAVPQEGGFYGGWITSDLTGPFKGGPGSDGW